MHSAVHDKEGQAQRVQIKRELYRTHNQYADMLIKSRQVKHTSGIGFSQGVTRTPRATEKIFLGIFIEMRQKWG